jgi:hypothetical protein
MSLLRELSRPTPLSDWRGWVETAILVVVLFVVFYYTSAGDSLWGIVATTAAIGVVVYFPRPIWRWLTSQERR